MSWPPSFSETFPQYNARPLGGVCLYSFSFLIIVSSAVTTAFLVAFDFMFSAVPASAAI